MPKRSTLSTTFMDRSFQGTYAPDLRTVTGSIIDGEDEPEYVCPSCCVHSPRLFLAYVASCVQLTRSFLPFFSHVCVCSSCRRFAPIATRPCRLASSTSSRLPRRRLLPRGPNQDQLILEIGMARWMKTHGWTEAERRYRGGARCSLKINAIH